MITAAAMLPLLVWDAPRSLVDAVVLHAAPVKPEAHVHAPLPASPAWQVPWTHGGHAVQLAP